LDKEAAKTLDLLRFLSTPSLNSDNKPPSKLKHLDFYNSTQFAGPGDKKEGTPIGGSGGLNL
jgi:hypothetical protein